MNFWFSCIYLPNSGIVVIGYHTQLCKGNLNCKGRENKKHLWKACFSQVLSCERCSQMPAVRELFAFGNRKERKYVVCGCRFQRLLLRWRMSSACPSPQPRLHTAPSYLENMPTVGQLGHVQEHAQSWQEKRLQCSHFVVYKISHIP